METGNQDEVSRLSALDWDADNIYRPEDFDSNGHMLRPKRVSFMGKALPHGLNTQRAWGTKALIQYIAPLRRPVRQKTSIGDAARGATRRNNMSLIWRKQDYKFSEANVKQRKWLRSMLLGYDVGSSIALDTIKESLRTEIKMFTLRTNKKLSDIVTPCKWNKWHEFLSSL